MLPRQHRLTDFKSFQEVLRRGNRYTSQYFRISLIKSTKPEPTKVGFVVSKKVARKASARNLLKRRMREVVRREVFSEIPRNTSIVIGALPGSVALTYNEITSEIKSILNKVK